MRLISRKQWGARYGDGYGDRPLPASEAWLHHSVTIAPDLKWVDADGDNVDDDEERAMRTIEDIGVQRFGGVYGFPYTFAVMPRGGVVYHGHRVGQMGAHTGGRNDVAIGIVLVGDYEARRPTEAQINAVAWLLRRCVALGWLKTPELTGGHRDVKATACPGQAAYDAIDEINRRAMNPQEDDMYTDADRSRDNEIWKAIRPGKKGVQRRGWLAKIIMRAAGRNKELYDEWKPGIPGKRFPGPGNQEVAQILSEVVEQSAKVAGLKEAVRQINDGQHSIEEIEAAALRAATEAIEAAESDPKA